MADITCNGHGSTVVVAVGWDEPEAMAMRVEETMPGVVVVVAVMVAVVDVGVVEPADGGSNSEGRAAVEKEASGQPSGRPRSGSSSSKSNISN